MFLLALGFAFVLGFFVGMLITDKPAEPKPRTAEQLDEDNDYAAWVLARAGGRFKS